VVALAAVLNLWDLAVSGWANAYYSAAAQAASQSWSAFFFGSFDASGFITVDKPPAAIWLMGMSVRLFGLSSWSILVPEALCGVASVVVLYLAVRRSFSAPAGVIAALVLALTPVAVAMFRYDNPDALLTLLLVSAAWAVVKAIEGGRMRWLLLAAVLVGLAFDTKYLQAFVVLPAFVLAFAVAAPGPWRERAYQLLAAGTTLVFAAGWWVAVVELIPAADRPFIGGSTRNSVLDLIVGYDGLGRIFGAQGPGGFRAPGGFGGGPGGPGFGGVSGPLRLFNEEWGGQIAWLLPAAAVAAVGGIAARWRAPRTDAARAGFLLWGGWLATHVAVFSLSSGIIHPYYAVVIAPAIAALVGGGLAEWHRARGGRLVADIVLAATTIGTAVLAWVLLARTPDFLPGLGVVVLALAFLAAVLVLVGGAFPHGRVVALGGGVLALVAVLAGPAAYAIDSATVAYAGGDPSAGPAAASDGGLFGRRPIASLGGAPGATAEAVDLPLVSYLLAHRGSARWIVAAQSANGAASIQLATGAPVMAMGGFSGGDPAPTADELAGYVASGELRYVFVGGRSGGPAGIPGGAAAPGGGIRGGAAAPGGGIPGGAAAPGGGFPGGQGFGSTGDRLSWVTTNCTQVDFGGGSGLYDCAPGG
jgi:4-amino-4-deoxy-L-arabinose transferase-like glycosyltransferase